MYSFIKGLLDTKSSSYIIVDCNGVGYKIFTSTSTLNLIGEVNNKVKLYTHLHVREDNMSLYGFYSQEELGMFELLITVSGVGPKAALALISCISPTKFSLAVVTEDVKTLTQAQGIGNKMAQRVILELKDKLKKENQEFEKISSSEVSSIKSDKTIAKEAVSALMVLGYSPLEANKAVNSVYVENINLEDLIKAALKGLVR